MQNIKVLIFSSITEHQDCEIEILIEHFSSRDTEGRTLPGPGTHRSWWVLGEQDARQNYRVMWAVWPQHRVEKAKGCSAITIRLCSPEQLHQSHQAEARWKMCISKILMQHKMLVIEQKSSSNNMSISSWHLWRLSTKVPGKSGLFASLDTKTH